MGIVHGLRSFRFNIAGRIFHARALAEAAGKERRGRKDTCFSSGSRCCSPLSIAMGLTTIILVYSNWNATAPSTTYTVHTFDMDPCPEIGCVCT